MQGVEYLEPKEKVIDSFGYAVILGKYHNEDKYKALGLHQFGDAIKDVTELILFKTEQNGRT